MEKKKNTKVTIEKIAELISDSQKLTVKRVDKRISQSGEVLARIVASGFSAQEKALSMKIEYEIQGIEQRLGAQILGTNNRIDALVAGKVSWDAHTRLAGRVTRLENSPRLGK